MLRGYRMISCAMVIALAGFFYTPSTANAELQQGNPATSNPTIYKQKHLQEIGQVAQWGLRHRSFSKVRLLRMLDARCKRGNRRACTQFKLFSKRYPAALQKMRSAQVRKPGRTNPRNRQAISSTRSTNNSGGAAAKARIAQLEKDLAASLSKMRQLSTLTATIPASKARIAGLEKELAASRNKEQAMANAARELTASKTRVTQLEGELAASAATQARVGELETQLAATAATEARVVELETQLAATAATEARVMELETQVAASAEKDAKIVELETQVAASAEKDAKIVELETQVAASAEKDAKIVELETQVAATAATQARVAELEAQLSAATTAQEPLNNRIADLERQLAAPPAPGGGVADSGSQAIATVQFCEGYNCNKPGATTPTSMGFQSARGLCQGKYICSQDYKWEKMQQCTPGRWRRTGTCTERDRAETQRVCAISPTIRFCQNR